jgi:hypothetical protein
MLLLRSLFWTFLVMTTFWVSGVNRALAIAEEVDCCGCCWCWEEAREVTLAALSNPLPIIDMNEDVVSNFWCGEEGLVGVGRLNTDGEFGGRANANAFVAFSWELKTFYLFLFYYFIVLGEPGDMNIVLHIY